MKKPHIHAEVIKAWADGAIVEVMLSNGTWNEVTNPPWFPEIQYRVKPEVKFKMGTRFKVKNSKDFDADEIYIMAAGPMEYLTMVSTKKGTWVTSRQVNDFLEDSISKSELKDMILSEYHESANIDFEIIE